MLTLSTEEALQEWHCAREGRRTMCLEMAGEFEKST